MLAPLRVSVPAPILVSPPSVPLVTPVLKFCAVATLNACVSIVPPPAPIWAPSMPVVLGTAKKAALACFAWRVPPLKTNPLPAVGVPAVPTALTASVPPPRVYVPRPELNPRLPTTLTMPPDWFTADVCPATDVMLMPVPALNRPAVPETLTNTVPGACRTSESDADPFGAVTLNVPPLTFRNVVPVLVEVPVSAAVLNFTFGAVTRPPDRTLMTATLFVPTAPLNVDSVLLLVSVPATLSTYSWLFGANALLDRFELARLAPWPTRFTVAPARMFSVATVGLAVVPAGARLV